MTTTASTIAHLRATAGTHQCRNTFFQKSELESLHDSLKNSARHLKNAVQKDLSVTDGEATAEIAVAISIIKEHYQALNPNKELEFEYRASNGNDFINRREPCGTVYIEPNMNHTPVLSVVAPLSAAIAAGNCVLLKVIVTSQESEEFTLIK